MQPLDSAPAPAGDKHAWLIPPGVTYLNHGSFGTPPRAVFEARQQFLLELAENPMDFLVRSLPERLQQATQELARFVNAPADGIVPVSNATTAMNVVAGCVTLKPGDEVLLTDHEYGAVIRIWGKACAQAGARTVTAKLPFPLTSPRELVDALFAQVTERTRLLVVSHVTSPTACILPVQQICERARERGVPVCIDGPHAPAMVPIDLRALKCDFYTASCHKWLSAPIGTGFLYAGSQHRSRLKPLVWSWGRNLNGQPPHWKDEFLWPGTFDPTGYLCVPVALEFFRRYGWKRFQDETHALAQWARSRLMEDCGLQPLTPDDPQWYGSMVALELPGDPPGDPAQVHPLQVWLAREHQIEVPVVRWRERTLLRVSAHLYNTREQMEQLTRAVQKWRSAQHSSPC